MKNVLTPFDKRDVFASAIEPQIQKLKELCDKNQIPFFLCCAVANDEEQTTYEQYACGALPMGLVLKDDKLVEHVKIAAGFQAMSPYAIEEVELS